MVISVEPTAVGDRQELIAVGTQLAPFHCQNSIYIHNQETIDHAQTAKTTTTSFTALISSALPSSHQPCW